MSCEGAGALQPALRRLVVYVTYKVCSKRGIRESVHVQVIILLVCLRSRYIQPEGRHDLPRNPDTRLLVRFRNEPFPRCSR